MDYEAAKAVGAGLGYALAIWRGIELTFKKSPPASISQESWDKCQERQNDLERRQDQQHSKLRNMDRQFTDAAKLQSDRHSQNLAQSNRLENAVLELAKEIRSEWKEMMTLLSQKEDRQQRSNLPH